MAVQRDKVLASAEKLVAKGKIEPAIKEYERLLEDNPNDVNTLNRIGDLWVRINRTDEAVKVFSKIADHYAKDGFFLKAIAIFKKINKLDPSKLDVYAKLADLYAKQGLAMEAKSQYQVLADYYLKHGDPANALAIYRKISDLDPNSINVHVKLADLYSQNNQTADALKEYDRVGKLLLKRGMLDEAVQVFRKALKIDAKNVELVDSLVIALIEAKDYNNAAQIVQTALEANGEHPRLLGTMGRIQLARGDIGAAQDALQRALDANPSDAGTRSALADIALRRNDLDGALRIVEPAVQSALERGDRAGALEPLTKILRGDAGHAATIERLVDVYTRLNEETNILASMNSLAEAHMSRGRFEQAATVLERLIQREPQNAQHRTKLQFVRSQIGGVDTMPARPRPEAPSLEIDEPPPSFELTPEPQQELTLDLDDSPSLDLDASPAIDLGAAPSFDVTPSKSLELDLSAIPAEKPAPAPAAPTHLMAAVEIAAQDTAGGEDLDFITEHLTEAEVFAKYGLTEKAIEHLRAIIDRSPQNRTAHERLFRLLLEEGQTDAARTAATAFVALLRSSSDTSGIDAIVAEFAMRGLEFSPEAAAPPPAVTAPEPDTTFAMGGAEAAEEVEFDLEEPAPSFGEYDEPTLAAEPAVEPVEFMPAAEVPAIGIEPETPELTSEETSFSFGEEQPAEFGFGEEEPAALELGEEQPEELTFGDEESAPLEVAAEEPATFEASGPAEEFGFGETAAEPDFSTGFAEEPPPLNIEEELPMFEEPATAAPEPVIEQEEAFFGEEELEPETIPGEPALQELGEIDFYIENDLLVEAASKLSLLEEQYPGSDELQARRERIAVLQTAAAPPPSPATLSREEIESELMSAIPDDEDEIPAPLHPPVPSPAAAASPVLAPPMAHAVQDENLFADEEDFFDLAAELESELAEEEEAISVADEEQSLEEIFKEFKKGVEQQLDSEDYDTHYNLGIAYKEMGLIDEAIGEFQLASKDPKRAVECASMLGLCFLEKGMPQLAIKWYRKGLEIPEITEDEHIGLLYDLASAHQEVGDTESAQRTFMEVYGMNSNYRDIVSRIKQLEGA